MRKIQILTALPMLALAACNQAETVPAEKAPVGDTMPTTSATAPLPAPAPSTEVAYDCTPAMAITVRYDNSDAKEPEADVTIDGKKYELDQVVAASGARYFTDDGRAERMTLTWWNKGTDGTLYEGNEGGDPTEKTITTCKQKV